MNDNYNLLIDKLDAFIRKYYTNQLIRGILYSIALLGSFFLLITLLESVAWFSPAVRTVIFYAYLLVALFVLGRFILLPLLKLNKAGKRISHSMAAEIIGRHFNDVRDVLLNTLQLNQLADSETANRDLILASINQKARQLQPVPFVSAIDLKQNRKYLVYALPPILIILVLLLAAPNVITGSGNRIINHSAVFTRPLPFQIKVVNDKLSAVQQEDFNLKISISGEEIPSEIFLVSNGSEIKMQQDNNLEYSYTFRKLQKNQHFQFLAAGYYSPEYELEVFPRPTILSFDLELIYPPYTGMKSELIANAGDAIVPEGSSIVWKFSTRDAKQLKLKIGEELRTLALTDKSNIFTSSKRIMKPVSYSVSLNNEFMQGSDSMSFFINVIPDVYPIIQADEYRDSIYDNRLYFKGLIKDDYGFNKLEFRLSRKTETGTSAEIVMPVNIEKLNTQQSFYHYFDMVSASLTAGDEVEYYFEIWDNDGVNGSKSTRSQKMSYRLPTIAEIEDMVKKNQENVKSELEKSIEEARAIKKEADELNKMLFDQKNLNYQEKKQIQNLIDRQKKLQDQVEMMKQQNEKSNKRESQYKEVNEAIAEKQQQLEKLFEEIMSDEMKKMFEELQNMMEELDKDKLSDMMEKLKFSAEDMEKSLDRNLELFKQLEFDKKLTETIDKLKELAEKQKELADKTKDADKQENQNISEEQKKINETFDDLKKELKDLNEKNKALEEPNNSFKIPTDKQNEIQKNLDKSSENIKEGEMKKASGSQKEASDDMQEMGDMLTEMQQDMAEEALGEDMDALRAILENLVQSSFDQESLMAELSTTNRTDPRYPKISEKQKDIRDNLDMIEDSLYALSKRQAMIEPFVNREITTINSNVDMAMKALGTNNTSAALGKQQYVMTSVNNLALLLAESLKQMQQNMAQMKSSGKSGKSCPMPGQGKPSMKSMRQMQQKLNEQMESMKKSMQEGKKGQQGKQGQSSMSEQLARMAAEQQALRRQLQEYRDQLQKEGILNDKGMNKMLQEMEQTETELVNKILNQETMRRQQEILTRLLESEKAEMQREQEERRESNEGRDVPKPDPASFFDSIGLPSKETELLRTIPPSLRNYYRDKVNEYFISIPIKE